MARNVSKPEARNYLDKAEEFLAEAKESMIRKRFTASAFNSIQSIINANDALTISLIGIRASRDHREAIKTHTEVVRTTGDDCGRQILIKALTLRSEVGYSGKAVSKSSAEKTLKDSIIFIEWAKKYITV